MTHQIILRYNQVTMANLQSPRGTRDILPADQPYWQKVLEATNKQAQIFGFQKIDLPIFEYTNLFIRGIGTGTDIIDKELFSVSRKENSENDEPQYSLRPEATAGIVRAYLEHGMQSWPQPVKLYTEGPMFRYDRPQKGRYRELRQFNAELIGDASPTSDALIILMMWEIFVALGLKDKVIIEVNSIGDKNCRPKINQALKTYYLNNRTGLCDDCQKRLKNNPLRLLDCKQPNCQKLRENAPQLIDLLDNACKEHFQNVLEYLEELEIPYDLNPYLVRGLDYYTRTTFEVKEKGNNRQQNSLAGGGRYDGLIELYGGKATPAIGFACGIDRIVDYLKEQGIGPLPIPKPDACIIQVGDKARRVSLAVMKELAESGLSVISAPGKDSIKSQLRAADKAGAKFALIIGQKEALDKTVIVKNLDDGAQETVTRAKLIPALYRRLNKS